MEGERAANEGSIQNLLLLSVNVNIVNFATQITIFLHNFFTIHRYPYHIDE